MNLLFRNSYFVPALIWWLIFFLWFYHYFPLSNSLCYSFMLILTCMIMMYVWDLLTAEDENKEEEMNDDIDDEKDEDNDYDEKERG